MPLIYDEELRASPDGVAIAARSRANSGHAPPRKAASAGARLSFEDILIGAALHGGATDGPACRRAIDESTAERGSAVEALLDAGLVADESVFCRYLADALAMDLSDDSEMEAEAFGGDGSLHERLPAKLALRHRVLPGTEADGALRLFTFDPFNLDARQAVGHQLGRAIAWVVAPREALLRALRTGYGVGAATFEDILDGRENADADDALAQDVTVLGEDEEATVMSFVNQIFREAVEERATDIHVEPMERDLRIRYRVDGALQEVGVPPNVRMLQASLISRLKIMAHLDIAERRLPQDGRINLELDGKRIDVRVATIPSVNGESVSLRILGRENFNFEALGLDRPLEEKIRKLLELPNGIILVTGPTGCGKSTSLYTFLRVLNTKARRIVTIEDPVENKLDGVVQIAVKPEIELTFASGLRSILRGDPNVIMVGEMRDLETTEIAIRGALTGHLVFSTLHTNDAVGGISRLLDMGIEPFLIASSVRAFLAQRLVRTLCGECKRPVPDGGYPEGYLRSINFPTGGGATLYEAAGCRACRGTGYRGRMVIMEMCAVSHEMQELIAGRASTSELRALARREGMVALRDHGWSRVLDGKTTIAEVLAVTAGDSGTS
ncbi:ATPase, T2SS/T4P/T4SS family [soil metagenome]